MNKRRFTLFVIIWLAVTIPAVIILLKRHAQPPVQPPAERSVIGVDSEGCFTGDLECFDRKRRERYEANISKYPTTPEKLLELVNSERAKAHVAPLRLDSRLNYSASLKLADMHKYDYNKHVNHDGKTRGIHFIIQAMPGVCQWIGENIKSDAKYQTAKEIIEDYMNSTAGHREAILDPRYDLVGFHTEHGRNVMHFCDLP